MEHRELLTIRMLGELQMAYSDGSVLPLPASKKTRALLAYLIATGQPHRRERLCDLFWDGPDDPRAELRWSLSKIRPLLEGGGAELIADREHVQIALTRANVDLLLLRSLLSKGAADASTKILKQSAALFGGEFLDGLDLPACHRYQEWCMAERETVSNLRLSVLTALIGRLSDNPESALRYARTLVAADPVSESGHAAVLRLLAELGRSKEAQAHYEHVCRIFKSELGVAPTESLKQAYQASRTVRVSQSSPPQRSVANAPHAASPRLQVLHFVGRGRERALIEQAIQKTISKQNSGILLVTGEPGIGKSHFLNHARGCMITAGGDAWTGRSFEPEATRLYGVWIDILRGIAQADSRKQLPPTLGILLPELGSSIDLENRQRFFDTIVGFIQRATRERAVAIILDDIQWIDEASCSLLHYVARQFETDSRLLVLCAARSGEIDDNAAGTAFLRSLARDKRLETIDLGPLSRNEISELVHLIDPALDSTGIFAASEGNPLFTKELARAHRSGDADPGPTVEAVITGQFNRLTEQTREVLIWASALGRTFTPDLLGLAKRVDPSELLPGLTELERREFVRAIGDRGDYSFTHDLVRQTIYRTLSQPRRKLIHRQIARALHGAVEQDASLAAGLVQHAALAQDYERAAGACVLAGERALRLFANVDAANYADRGLAYCEHLGAGRTRIENSIALFKVRILAASGPGMRSLPRPIDALTNLAEAAAKNELPAAAATAHHLLSILHQEAGDTSEAQASTLRAATAGRSTDEVTRAGQFANTGRCLLELEIDIERSRELVRESSSIVGPLGLELCELHWAQGLLHRWDGEAELAIESISRALALARHNEDRWREYKCLTWLAMIEQEHGRYDRMRARCIELAEVASRLAEDEVPFVSTLEALALLATHDDPTEDKLAEALGSLRTVDDKSYLTYALNTAATLHLRAGRAEKARMYAIEAAAAARTVNRKSEAFIAQTVLAHACGEQRSEQLDRLLFELGGASGLSARARSILFYGRDSNGGFNGAQATFDEKRR